MYIRKTKTGQARDGNTYFTYRIVESRRIDGKVRQKTILNLGRNFSIPKKYWSSLCDRISELIEIDTTKALQFEFDDIPAEVETCARSLSKLLIDKKAEEAGFQKDIQLIDVNSARTNTPRTIGIEHAAYEALKTLRFPELLRDLGFNQKQLCCALAIIIGRIAEPSSERATIRWLRQVSSTGEMLNLDFDRVNEMALYRASDQLLKNQQKIEEHLFRVAHSLFEFTPSITLYDLTNTYFEGKAASQPKAQRGRSKEKRSDAPLLTLGLVVDASGFVRRSNVFAGNISEAGTLAEMLNDLDAPNGGIIIMDRGIATQANLRWMRDSGYKYLVISRDTKRKLNNEEQVTLINSSSGGKVSVYLENKESEEEDGEKFEEVFLRCRSEAQAEKEKGIPERFQCRFEDELIRLRDGLSRPRTVKKLEKIHRRIGRLETIHAGVAQNYKVTVIPDEKGNNAVGIEWTLKPANGSIMQHPSVYFLRSNILNWDAETMWRIYTSLTDVETAFRSMKSERGLRSICHQNEQRADSHLFISVIAYQAIQVLRQRMKATGENMSWSTVRKILRHLSRSTTSFERKDGRTLHVRTTDVPEEVQEALYKAMGIKPPKRKSRITVI